MLWMRVIRSATRLVSLAEALSPGLISPGAEMLLGYPSMTCSPAWRRLPRSGLTSRAPLPSLQNNFYTCTRHARSLLLTSLSVALTTAKLWFRFLYGLMNLTWGKPSFLLPGDKNKLSATAGSEKRMWMYQGKTGKRITNARLSGNSESHFLRDPSIQQIFTKHPHMWGKFWDFHPESELLLIKTSHSCQTGITNVIP